MIEGPIAGKVYVKGTNRVEPPTAKQPASGAAGGAADTQVQHVDLQADLRHLRCGALARSTGQPCRSLAIVFGNGRCKLHGGMSTGPTSEAGRTRAALNKLQPKGASQSTPEGDKNAAKFVPTFSGVAYGQQSTAMDCSKFDGSTCQNLTSP